MSDSGSRSAHLRLVDAPSTAESERRADNDDLMAAVGRGDREAVRAIYLEHHAAVRTFALRLLGDAAAAEDVVHEVFVTLPQIARTWRRAGTLRSFLVGVAVNLGRHHIRASARRRAVATRLAREPAAGGPVPPDRKLEREQLAAELLRALDTLPDDQRIAFVLSEVEGCAAAEGAALMRVREGTFRARVFLARRKLRSLFEEESRDRSARAWSKKERP